MPAYSDIGMLVVCQGVYEGKSLRQFNEGFAKSDRNLRKGSQCEIRESCNPTRYHSFVFP